MINQIIYRVVAQECERFPSRKLTDIWASCKDRLIELGLPAKSVDSICTNTHLQSVFAWRLVPNPLYWQRKFGDRFYFYLIKAPSKRYHDLLDSLRTHLADVSFFICYGELDVIIRWVGDEQSVDQIENLLISWGVPPATVEVRNIPLYYRYEVTASAKLRDVRLSAEVVDQALALSPEELDAELIKELMDSGVVLGTVYLEDTHITNRIHAFIGIKFDGPVQADARKQFEQALLRINEDEYRNPHSRPLFSIYQCGLHYDYLLEVMLEDQGQLDAITDKIQRFSPRVFDTETLILAKSHLSPMSFSQRRHESAERFAILRQILANTLTPLADSLLQDFPGQLETLFPRSNSEAQFLALSLYRDIWVRNPYSKEGWFVSTKEYFASFIQGVLEERPAQVRNSVFGFIRDVVEEQHRNLAQIIVNNCFSGDSRLLQRELKTDDANWQKWGLAKWANHVYPNWNAHKLYGAIVKFSPEFLQSLEFVGNARNRLAHDPTVQDIDHLIQEARQIFYHSFQILAWLRTIFPTLDSPAIPLSTVSSIVLSGPQSGQFELLLAMKKMQVDVQELARSIEQQARQFDERWGELAIALTQLQSGIGRIDDRTLEIVEELVIPKVSEKDKGKSKQLIDYLRESAKTLPAEFAANLLWGLISSALGSG